MLRHIIYTILYIMTRHNLYKLFIKPFTVWPKESCQTFLSKIDRNWWKSNCKTSWWRHEYFFHGKLTNIKLKITVALVTSVQPRWVDTIVRSWSETHMPEVPRTPCPSLLSCDTIRVILPNQNPVRVQIRVQDCRIVRNCRKKCPWCFGHELAWPFKIATLITGKWLYRDLF